MYPYLNRYLINKKSLKSNIKIEKKWGIKKILYIFHSLCVHSPCPGQSR